MMSSYMDIKMKIQDVEELQKTWKNILDRLKPKRDKMSGWWTEYRFRPIEREQYYSRPIEKGWEED